LVPILKDSPPRLASRFTTALKPKRGEASTDRFLDVHLSGSPLSPGEIVTLTAQLILEDAKARGNFGAPILLDPHRGLVTFHLDYSGFELLTGSQNVAKEAVQEG
jgi:hypothetical protein